MFFYAAWFGGFGWFSKKLSHEYLCVMGSTPIRSNAIAQFGRAIEVYAGSIPALLLKEWVDER
ncbi:hypothetical protein ASD98_06750 [Flavobacterium sp. Root186]|nr:hypothetical protein ASD98_06750 [Flavobacterium sp. Root186]